MKQAIKLIRNNRRTISLEITPSGQVLVRAPKHMSEREIQRFVEEKSSWLAKHLQKRKEDMDSLQGELEFQLSADDGTAGGAGLRCGS